MVTAALTIGVNEKIQQTATKGMDVHWEKATCARRLQQYQVQNPSPYPTPWIGPRQPSFAALARACSLPLSPRLVEQVVKDYS